MTAEIAGEIFLSISESVRLTSSTRSTTWILSVEIDGSLECIKSTHLLAVLVDGKSIACSPGVPTFLTISSAKAAISLWMKNLSNEVQISDCGKSVSKNWKSIPWIACDHLT